MAIQVGQEVLRQRCFACANFPRNDDESVVLAETVFQMRKGPAVNRTLIEESCGPATAEMGQHAVRRTRRTWIPPGGLLKPREDG